MPALWRRVFDHGMSYVCEKALGSVRTCDFKIRKIILSRPLEREQVAKLLHTGKTDLLQKFISKKGRPFSAYLVARCRTEKWDSSLSQEIQRQNQHRSRMKQKSVKPKAKSSRRKKIASGKI